MASGATALAAGLQRALLNPAQAGALRVPGRVDAAVLVALFAERDDLHAVLTERRHDLRRHPGEIAFPGGRLDAGDPDLLACALREAHEEIGLAPGAVRVLGALQPTPTIATGYRVHPFVALIEPGATWTLSPREVAEVLELPLARIHAGYARRTLLRRGVPIRTDTYLASERLIWGATARILSDLLERLQAVGADAAHGARTPAPSSP